LKARKTVVNRILDPSVRNTDRTVDYRCRCNRERGQI